MMTAAGASYALVTPLVKEAALAHVPIRLVTVFQFPAALLLFLVAALIEAAAGRARTPDLVQWPSLALVGLAGAATALSYYQSLRFLPASLAIVMLFQFAWMLPVVAWFVDRAAPSKTQWLAIAGIAIGTLLAAGLSHPRHLSLLGIVLGLTAGLSYALTLFWQGRVSTTSSPWSRSLISTAVGFIPITLVLRPWATPAVHGGVGQAFFIGSLVGLFGQALPMLLVYVSAPNLGNTLTAILASVELPVAVLLAAAWLHEPVQGFQWLGVLIMLGAIVWGSLPQRSGQPAPDP